VARQLRWQCPAGFPANYVEEVTTADDDVDASPLGSLQKGTIDLTGVTVGQHMCSLTCTFMLFVESKR